MRLWDLPDAAWTRIDIVQVRGKELSSGELERLAGGWVERLGRLSVRVVVNDRLDVALAAGAQGAHLGRDDLPVAAARAAAPAGFVLGASTHDRDELLDAQSAGADYAGLGAFHTTTTKPQGKVLDPARAGLAEPVTGLAIPVLAVGGLDADRVAEALTVPAVTGVAVSGAIQGADDPARAIERLVTALGDAWRAREEGAAW